MTQVSARASAPEQSPGTHTDTTYFLAIDDLHELKIAQAWLKATYPQTRAKITRELPLHRLNQNAIVIPLIRGEDRSPAVDSERLTNGTNRPVHRKPIELISEVRECTPVPASKHWKSRSDEWDAFGGELNRDTFHCEVSVSVTPCQARTHIGSPNILRLTF